MTLGINFVGKITPIPAYWANQVNTLVYDVFGAATTVAAAQAALGLKSMAYQSHDAIEVLGGSIDNVDIGLVTPVTAVFQSARVLDSGASPDSVVSRQIAGDIAVDHMNARLNQLLPNIGDMLVRSANGVTALPVDENSWALQPNSDSVYGVSWTTFTQLVERNPTDDPGQRGFAGDIQVRTATEYARLPLGAEGHVLMVDPTQPQKVRWAPTSLFLPIRDPGDLLTIAGSTPTRLPVGVNGQVLMADSNQPEGLRWANVVFPQLTNKGDLLTRNNSAYQALTVGSEGALLQVDESTATGIKWAPYVSVIPLTTKGDLFGHNGTAGARVPVGTAGQVLTPSTGAPNGVIWTGARAVLPLTTKGDILIDTGSDLARLPVGTNGYVLQADSAQASGMRWAPASTFVSPLTTKGDIYVHNGAQDVRLPAGSANQVLIADPGSLNGVRWATRPNYVSPTTTKGDLIARTTTIDARVPVGTDGQVLVADSSADTGVAYRSMPYDLQFSSFGSQPSNTRVGMLVVPRSLTINGTWTGTIGRAASPSMSSASQFVVRRAGVDLCTLHFAVGQANATVIPASSDPIALVAGDLLTLHTATAPNYDSTIQDVCILVVAHGGI